MCEFATEVTCLYTIDMYYIRNFCPDDILLEGLGVGGGNKRTVGARRMKFGTKTDPQHFYAMSTKYYYL
jgi:hypothetical protein